MRVVVLGASGNVGTSLLQALGEEESVDSVVGVARRLPEARFGKTEWTCADVARDDLVPILRGADAVVHLAWAIQPSHDDAELRRVNVTGSERVFRAVADAGVPALVYASSVGAYSPGPKDDHVDETWPTGGIRTSFYSRHKVEVERLLDRFEREHPDRRVVRLRPALIFKRDAASGIRRLFAGPLLPGTLLRGGRLPIVPRIERLVFQAVHSLDVGHAYRLAVTGDARGAFNIAAEPVLDPTALARITGGRIVPVPAAAARLLASASWRAHLQPTPPGWLDLALQSPLMSTTRARAELGWQPARGADDALHELLAGIGEGAGIDTPPLAPGTGGPFRVRELLTGIGRSSGE